jgi:hypothetical protein
MERPTCHAKLQKEQATMSVTSNSWRPETVEGRQDYYSPALALFSICGLTFLMVLFNFFPQFVGIVTVNDEVLQVVPLFSSHFYETYLPLLNILWGLAIGLQAVLLTSQLAMLGLAIIFMIATDGPVFVPAEDPLRVFSWLLTPLLWFILLVTGIDVIKKFVHLLRTV